MASYLRKLILLSVITGSALFLIAMAIGIKQTLFLSHFENTLAKSTELNFRLANLKERLTYSALFKKGADFQQIISELQALSPFLIEISNDLLIPAELKSIGLVHADVASLIMLLHGHNNSTTSDEEIVRIQEKTTEIVAKSERFNVELRNHILNVSKSNSLLITGILLTVCILITLFLLYINKKIVLPLASLMDEITAKRFDGDYSRLATHPESKFISVITDYFNYFVNLYYYEKEIQQKTAEKSSVKCCGHAVTGEVASEIAHDIIDRANGVINYAEVIRDEIEPMHSTFLMESIAKLQDEGKLIAEYASQILYSSCDDELCEKVSVKDILERILRVLGRKIRQEQAEVTLELSMEFLELRIRLHVMSMVLLAILLAAIENISKVKSEGKKKIITLKGAVKNGNVFMSVTHQHDGSLPSEENGIQPSYTKDKEIQISEERLQMLAMFLAEKDGSLNIKRNDHDQRSLSIELTFPTSI